MAHLTLATPSPVSCRPLSSWLARPLPLHASPSCLRYQPKAVAFPGIRSWPFELAEAHSFGSCPWKAEARSFGNCLWKAHAIEARASFASTSCSNFNLLRWLALLLYRALLVGGIGLSLGQVAAVYAAVAPTPSVSEVLTKDAANGKQTAAEEEKQAAGVLGDEFWSGLQLVRGSDELVLKQVLDSDPSNLSALECLAKTLMDEDNYSHALVVLEKLEDLQPNELEWKFMKADAYDLNGKSELAKKIFEDILKAEPFSSRALQGLILAMDQLNQSESAMKILEDTWNRAKQENNHVEARNFGMLIGQVHMFKGRMNEALQHYKSMIDDDPSDFRPYLNQGIIYCVIGEIEKAEDSFQNFERLCPEDLPSKEILDGLKARARKEGQKIFESKDKKNPKEAKKEENGRKKGDSGLGKWFSR